MLCLTAPRKLHKREGGWVQKTKLPSHLQQEKWPSCNHGPHRNMAFPLPVQRLFLLRRLQPFTAIAFWWMWVHKSVPLSFVYIYLIYRQERAFSLSLVYIPHMYETYLQPAHCFRHCSILLLHHCLTIFVNVVLPVTIGTFWWDLPLPISSSFAQRSMQLPAASQNTRDLYLLLLDLSVLFQGTLCAGVQLLC